MRKLLAGLLAAALAVGAALPVWADTVPRKVDPDSYQDILDTIPSLTVAYNGKTQEAPASELNYNGMITDSAGPLGSTGAPVFQRRDGIHTVGLSFSRRPDKIEVSRWDVSARGKPGTSPAETQTLSGSVYTLPDNSASLILSATGYWKKSGSPDSFEHVTYVFEIAAASEGKDQIPLEKLPANYPFELAAANGDVAISMSGAENLDRLYLFISMVKQGSAASVRIVVYSKEGEPYFYDLNYNGNQIICKGDFTRGESGAGKVESKSYASLELSECYNSAYDAVVTDLKLRSADGTDRLIVSFTRPDVELMVSPASATGNEKTLQLEIFNNTDSEMTCDETFLLEQLTGSGWKAVPFTGNSQPVPWTAVIAPEGSDSCAVSLADITRPLAAGRYRIVKALRYDGKSKRAYAQFEVQQVRTFRMETPVSLSAVSRKAGVVSSAELTRKGRYAGSSPLVYVSGQLARLNGKPLVGTERDSDGLITVTAGFADGSSKTLDFYSDGRFRAPDGVYQFGSSEVYENIKGCLESVKNSK